MREFARRGSKAGETVKSRSIRRIDLTGRLTDFACPSGEGNPARADYRPIPTTDGGLLFTAVIGQQPTLFYVPKDCATLIKAVDAFDLPEPFYGHYPWDEVIAWHE